MFFFSSITSMRAKMKVITSLLLITFLGAWKTLVDKKQSRSFERPEDEKLCKLVNSQGFDVEFHTVTTDDGFILGLHRIIPPKNVKRSRALPVLLMHGILGGSHDFVINTKNQSLAYVLSEQGYDVWLGNVRGNTYSARHKKYKTNTKEFWNFSMDEMALLDLPAIVDYILKETVHKQLYYIGFSMGSTIGMAFLADKQEYNEKVKLAILMGPVGAISHVNGFLRFLVTQEIFLEDIVGQKAFLPNSQKLLTFSRLYCDIKDPYREMCENVYLLIHGPKSTQMDKSRMPIYNQFNPAGSSARVIGQYSQILKADKLQKFNYGETKNLKLYGQATPPEYVIENIQTPVALLWCLNDSLADPVDVALLKKRIKNLRAFYKVPYPEWTHVDFSLGVDTKKYVYNELLRILEEDAQKF